MQQGNENWHLEKTYESLMSYGTNAIKFVLLANGGAIIALLTFLGNQPHLAKNLKCALLIYVLGVILGGTANVTAYFTQLSLFNEETGGKPIKLLQNHETWLGISVTLIIFGILLFALGSIVAAFSLDA